MGNNIIPRNNCIWEETIHVSRRATSYYVSKKVSKYNFAKIKIHLTKNEKATKINMQKKINGK